MLKTIPKSNITKRKFQVYKLWNSDDSSYQTVTSSDPLYKSIKTKYYSQSDGNVINLFGSVKNPANISIERQLADTICVIDIDRKKLGERLKPHSLKLIDNSNSTFVDDGFGRIVNPIPTYTLVSMDLQEGILIIEQDSIQYQIDISTSIPINLNSGEIILTLNGDTDTCYLVSLDFENNLVVFKNELDFEGVALSALAYGNVFYSDGVIVLNSQNVDLSSYSLEYRSTQTIYETEILITARAGEFNYSQNPSAVDVLVSNEYHTELTPITNSTPGGFRKIKEIEDISRKEQYSGSIGSSIGTWDDYFMSSSIDPTGSYLAPYITTIGIFDDDGDMVAIAKLPNPIKNLPDYDINFLIRFDT